MLYYCIILLSLIHLANQDIGEFDESFGLYGSQSKSLKDILSKSEEKYSLDVWRNVSALFCVRDYDFF